MALAHKPKYLLKKLLTELDNYEIRNLSIFIPDPIKFAAAFRISLKRLFNLIDELNWQTSSWINSTRLVLDTPYGKVRREDLIFFDEKEQKAVFQRENHQIHYCDFPKKLDKPGKIKNLLWKD